MKYVKYLKPLLTDRAALSRMIHGGSRSKLQFGVSAVELNHSDCWWYALSGADLAKSNVAYLVPFSILLCSTRYTSMSLFEFDRLAGSL